MEPAIVTVSLARKHGIDEYRVPYEEGMNALSALRAIYETLDRSVAYPVCLCRMGRCGACALRIDGKPALGCAAKLEEGGHYLFEPINDKRIIRDLVCE